MGILEKVKSAKQNTKFNKDELEFLLKLIADSTFEGKDVQVVYSTAVKLQTELSE